MPTIPSTLMDVSLIIDTMCFDFDGALLGHASTSPEGIPLVAGSGRRANG